MMTIFLISELFFDKKSTIQLNGYKILTFSKTLDLYKKHPGPSSGPDSLFQISFSPWLKSKRSAL
jgi:hypothetical protein